MFDERFNGTEDDTDYHFWLCSQVKITGIAQNSRVDHLIGAVRTRKRWATPTEHAEVKQRNRDLIEQKWGLKL